MSKIEKIHARQILDSRGNPTIEVEITTTNNIMGRAAVPSGASTGSKEALELRDLDKSFYMGKSVLKAVKNVNTSINDLLKGKSVFDQADLDKLMIDLDGTENKEKLGANAMLGVSMALARTAALEKKKSLFRYLKEDLACPNKSGDYILPAPLMNIINGGAHADNALDIQEFMIVPHVGDNFSDNIRAGVEVFHHLKSVLSKKGFATNVGDEGGFAPALESHEQALESITQAIENASYKVGTDISISLDAAASEFYQEGSYTMINKPFSGQEMIKYYSDLCANFPIYSIEDGLDENDNSAWTELTKALGDKTLLVGDDLFVTNKKILQKGIENSEANSILIKVNQIGTLSETFETLELAFANDIKAIISHRSGETGDTFIADLAVACGCGHIKTGSASRSDRLEKYNQLLRIEEELGNEALYHKVK